MDFSFSNTREIPGFNGYYRINELGEVFSLRQDWKKMSCRVCKTQGYVLVKLSPQVGVSENYKVHRLLYRTFVGEIPAGFCIDHRNGNRSDNTLSNLRLADSSQNITNSFSKSKTGYRGVSLDRKTGKWRATAGKRGKSRYLGQFPSLIEALVTYDLEAIKLYGPYAKTNIIKVADSLEKQC